MNLKRITTIAMATLSGACFGVAVSTFLLTNGYLSKSYRAYIVESGSMEPALSTGAVVITKAHEAYSIGDIITFSQGGSELVTHRIVSIANEGGQTIFKTKGDANEEADNWSVNKNQVVGKSILAIPKIGYLADFVRTPKGFVVLVVIPASIIIYEELKAVLRELKNLAFRKNGKGSQNSKAAALIPITGILLLFVAKTSSFSFDLETSLPNMFGMATPPPAASTPTLTPTPTIDLKINEFVANADTTFPNEWVEIYNNGNTSVDLTSWDLVDAANTIKDLSSLGSIAPGAFIVYEDVGDGWLNNSGDTLNLRDPSDVIMDTHTFGGIGQNISIGRDTDGTGTFKSCTTSTKEGSNNGSC